MVGAVGSVADVAVGEGPAGVLLTDGNSAAGDAGSTVTNPTVVANGVGASVAFSSVAGWQATRDRRRRVQRRRHLFMAAV